jgi:holin-like protein
MRYAKQFGIILFVTFLGEVLKFLIPLQIPASIYGLILMLLALKFKIVPLASVRDAGKFMIEIMPMMFIPAAVGILNAWELLKPIFIPVLLITVISTVAVMAVSGRVTQLFLHKEKAKKPEEESSKETISE